MAIKPLSLVLSTMLLLSMQHAMAADSTINITGTVIASPCTVVAVKDVDLGTTIDASKLATAGTASNFISFNLDMTNCPASTTKATATFTGPVSHVDYYANATGSAKHAIVELVSNYSSTNMGNGKIFSTAIDAGTHAGTFGLKARIRNDGDGSAVTPGTVITPVEVTIAWA
ncbi:fimbrial protein [Rahnella selenatireducens]|uniref:fimbrial protein n=1 Tax=Rahnella selenatireducens TaxID=3389797 RepID=UPI003969053E